MNTIRITLAAGIMSAWIPACAGMTNKMTFYEAIMNSKISFCLLRLQKWVIFLFVLPLLFAGPARAGSYLNSAHGDSGTIGVCREGICDESSGTNFGYSRGNCANCHEQHASIGGSEPAPASGSASPFLLFADSTTPYLLQSENVCFYCHAYSSSLQVGGIINYDFSQTFGGSTGTIKGIQEAFNITSPSSRHNLADIYDYITGTGTGSSASDSHTWADFPLFSSPCSGCHNVHIAKRNESTPGNPANTAISKPSDHGNLWGDDSTEILSYYTTDYQPPYYYSSSNTYEPDGGGTATQQAAKMPDYVTFCTDCHNQNNTIYSTTLGRDLIKINWSTSGTGADQHGSLFSAYVSSGTGTRVLKDPYNNTATPYVLSCLDCHEPHGSPNITLLRREVNGGDLAVVGTITADLPNPLSPATSGNNINRELGYLCMRCHQQDSNTGTSTSNPPKWENVHHHVTGHPYRQTMGCSCHGPGGGGPGGGGPGGGGPGGGGPGGGGPGGGKPPIECDKCHFHGGTDYWLTVIGSSQAATPARKTF